MNSDPRFSVTMDLWPGDMQFLNNHEVSSCASPSATSIGWPFRRLATTGNKTGGCHRS